MAAEKRNSFKLAQTQTRGNVKKAIDGVFRTICFQDMLALVLWWAMLDYEWQNGKTSVVPLIMGNRIGKIKSGQNTITRETKSCFPGYFGLEKLLRSDENWRDWNSSQNKWLMLSLSPQKQTSSHHIASDSLVAFSWDYSVYVYLPTRQTGKFNGIMLLLWQMYPVPFRLLWHAFYDDTRSSLIITANRNPTQKLNRAVARTVFQC